MSSTALVNNENISMRAYQIWEETGRQEGNEKANWLRAENELRAQHAKGGVPDPSRGKSVEPPPAGKHVPEKAPHSTNYVHPGATTDSLHHLRRN
jgi:hypothetical protein